MALEFAEPWKFTDERGTMITSKEQVLRLKEDGLVFEASVVLATVVEALCWLSCFLGANRCYPPSRHLFEGKTFGQQLFLAGKLELMELDLLKRLSIFNRHRNKLIHAHLAHHETFKYESFFNEGLELVDILKPMIAAATQRRLGQIRVSQK